MECSFLQSLQFPRFNLLSAALPHLHRGDYRLSLGPGRLHVHIGDGPGEGRNHFHPHLRVWHHHHPTDHPRRQVCALYSTRHTTQHYNCLPICTISCFCCSSSPSVTFSHLYVCFPRVLLSFLPSSSPSLIFSSCFAVPLSASLSLTHSLPIPFFPRLPIIQGCNFAYLAPSITILSSFPACNTLNLANLTAVERQEEWQIRMRELQGAIAVSALLQVVLGFTGQ